MDTENRYKKMYTLKEVSIDRLHIGVDSYSVGSALQNMFIFPISSKFYHQKYSSHGFTVYIQPKVPYIPKVKLIINTKYFRVKLSEKIKRVLALSQDWYIQAMDVAYDFSSKISNTYVQARTNAKKDKSYNPNTYYFSRNSDSRALLYDKKKQLREKRRIEIADDHLIRYEIRMRLGKSKKRLSDRDVNYIRPFMDKHTFIVSYSSLPHSTHEKKIIRDSKDRKKENLVATNHTKQKIRKVIREHSVPFFNIFESEWLKMSGYIIDAIENKEESQPTMELTGSVA